MSSITFLVFHVVECWFFLGDEVRRMFLALPTAFLVPFYATALTAVGPLAAQPPVVAVVVLDAAPQPEQDSLRSTHTTHSLPTTDSPAEGVILSNTAFMPGPFVVEREAAVGWVDERELLDSSLRSLEGGCGVHCAAASSTFNSALWGYSQ